MPLASPIGSGLGIRNEHNLELIRKMCSGLIFVDAGIGKPSDSSKIMELGFDGVLLNSSVARSFDPPSMAEAMKLSVISGRLGYKSGFIEIGKLATASTTFKGKSLILTPIDPKKLEIIIKSFPLIIFFRFCHTQNRTPICQGY